MGELMWQCCGQLRYHELTDKDFFSFYNSPEPPVPSNFSGRLGVVPLEMSLPVGIGPLGKHFCWFITTIQLSNLSQKNFSLRLAHFESWANSYNFKLLPLTGRGEKQFIKAKNQTSIQITHLGNSWMGKSFGTRNFQTMLYTCFPAISCLQTGDFFTRQ